MNTTIKQINQFQNDFFKLIDNKIIALSAYYSYYRKLGPSLTIYKPTILSLISIFLRITGHFFFFAFGVIYLFYFFIFFKHGVLIDYIFYPIWNNSRLIFIYFTILILVFHIFYGFTHMFNLSEKKIKKNEINNKLFFVKNILIYFMLIIILGTTFSFIL
jgi:succinate dehydrogenase/fumarate reductase cytochrome b subunit